MAAGYFDEVGFERGAGNKAILLPGETVTVYQDSPPGTQSASLQSLFSNELLTVPLANPFTADSLGNIVFWADATWVWVKVGTRAARRVRINQVGPIGPAGPQGDVGLANANIWTGHQTFKSGRPWVDVRADGALTDGTNATATTAAILAGNTRLEALGGGTLFFGGASSVYLINAQIPLKSNVTYKFEPGAQLKTAPGVDLIQMLGTNVSNVTIEDPTLDGNKANQTDDGLSVTQVGIYLLSTTSGGVTNCVIRGPYVKNFWGVGILASSSAAGNALEVDIVGAKTTNCRRGIFVDRPTDCNIINGRSWLNVWDGIWIGNGVNTATEKNAVQIHGNKCWKNANHGIVANWALNNFEISENHCWQNGWDGSVSSGGYWGIVVSEGCDEFLIANNICWGNPGNITVDPVLPAAPTSLQVVKALVVGNVCSGATVSHGINLNKPERIGVIGNTCDGNLLSGIAGQAKHVLVDGNTLTNNGAYGLKINATGGVGSDWTVGVNHYAGNALGTHTTEGGPTNVVYAGVPTVWAIPTLNTGWTAAAGAQGPRYRLVGDVVEIEGTAQNTSGGASSTDLFTLPAGFRPLAHQHLRYPQSIYAAVSGACAPNASVANSALLSLQNQFSVI